MDKMSKRVSKLASELVRTAVIKQVDKWIRKQVFMCAVVKVIKFTIDQS